MPRNRFLQVAVLFLVFVLDSLPAKGQELAAHVEVILTPSTWTYTLFNDEAAGSANYINSFQLTVSASITVTSTPSGWDFDTDGATSVLWFNTETVPPYLNDIAPGTSLGGFQIESVGASSLLQPSAIFSWNHVSDMNGPLKLGFTPAPTASVPEPTPFLLVIGAGITGIGFIWRYSRRSYGCTSNSWTIG